MRKSAMERAFELARSGRFKVSKDIDRTLKREGYNNVEVAFLSLPSVRKDLLRTCRSADKLLGEPNATPAKSDVIISSPPSRRGRRASAISRITSLP